MARDLFHYDKMIERALRGVVREALGKVVREGLRGGHHFYIAFATTTPGIVIPDALRAKFPAEMTIVLQHQFWDLTVGEDAFSVTLSFQKEHERLTVPFAAIRSFADPSVSFALEFPGAAAPSAAPSPPPAVIEAPAMPERPAAEVVALDRFRKR